MGMEASLRNMSTFSAFKYMIGSQIFTSYIPMVHADFKATCIDVVLQAHPNALLPGQILLKL